jgi:hypothetical protein
MTFVGRGIKYSDDTLALCQNKERSFGNGQGNMRYCAADDQNARFPKWRELSADIKMERRRLSLVDAELHDRNVGGRINMSQHRLCAMHRPCAMV